MKNLRQVRCWSIYFKNKERLLLPMPACQLLDEVAEEFEGIRNEINRQIGNPDIIAFAISDMLRSWRYQWLRHKEKPSVVLPQYSYHVAGLAFDYHTSLLNEYLSRQKFIKIVRNYNWQPISSEDWHIQRPFKNLGFKSLKEAQIYIGNYGG